MSNRGETATAKPMLTTTLKHGLGIGLIAGFAVGLVLWYARPVAGGAVAEFACPLTGTTFVMSRPLAIAAEPGFRNLVKIAGHDAYDCHIMSQANGDYWLHAGLIDTDRHIAWRAAAEQLWPLKVGNKSHAHFQEGGKTWSVDYRVVAYEPVLARVGAYEAFKIVSTLEEDGRLVYTVTRWWSPALKYTLSYRLIRTDHAGDAAWEIAEIMGRPA